MSSIGITPGEQIISVISAQSGGFGEQVLKVIASPLTPNSNQRIFGEWKNGICEGKVLIEVTGEWRKVILKLGVKEGLYLEDKDHFSLKHICDGDLCRIPVAKKSNKECYVNSVANNIIGSWVIHGRWWGDRVGTKHPWPYGIDEARKLNLDFEVCDGAGQILEQVLKKGIIRSAHIGQWDGGTTIVPAAFGIPILLHEFEKRADGKGRNNITIFRDQKISDDKDIWGPCAKWSRNINEVYFGEFSSIAKLASSPFNFHVAATRQVFPNCELGSSFILKSLKEEKILKILKIIAEKDPERFYRLIDEYGRTWELKKVTGDSLVFRFDYKERIFSIDEVPKNVLKTFQELSHAQESPQIKIKQVQRIVPDTHFFVVLFGMLTARNGSCHYISGSEMHEYLTTGKDAYAHKIRNDRLFCLIKDELEMDKLKFFIYPSNSLRITKLNQYNFTQEEWNKSYWINKKLI